MTPSMDLNTQAAAASGDFQNCTSRTENRRWRRDDTSSGFEWLTQSASMTKYEFIEDKLHA